MTTTAPTPACASCGAELSATALFCLGCGTAVPRELRVAGRPRPPAWFAGPEATTDDGPQPVARTGPAPAPPAEPVLAPEPPPAPPVEPVAVPTPEVSAPEQEPPGSAATETGGPAPTTLRLRPAQLPRWVALGAAVAVLAVIAVIALLLTGSGPRDLRGDAVAAWRAGNAAWAKGDIESVCDNHDGIGGNGMWPDRATCIASERQGYAEATERQRQGLEAMVVDPASTQQVSADTVVIWFRDARVEGERPPYFAVSDLAVMRLIEDQGWRQVGARYGRDVIGSVPQTVLAAVQPSDSPVPTSS